jgi:dienelactone hydrolase
MNFYNVLRATRGLVAYCIAYRKAAGIEGKASIVYAHDTRHFSKEFAQYAANIATDLGVNVYLFDGCRATPEMSYAVRTLRADAGVMLTASHNPPHDNGYKVNFNDGAGIVEPHATGIIKEVNAIKTEAYEALPEAERGTITVLGAEMDADYLKRVKTLMLKPELLEKAKGLKIVFTALHGTGGNKETQLALLAELAADGFIAVAIDARYHGARASQPKGTADYNAAILRAFQTGQEHPFFIDSAWDISRLVDCLVARDDVDPARIALIGFSKGGIEAYLTAAADPRIAATVAFIGVQSFGWAVDHNAWQSRIGTIQPAFDAAAKASGATKPDAAFVRRFYDRVAPGIYDRFDGPAMLPLIAPRPFLDGSTLPAVKELGLMNSAWEEELIKAVLASKILPRLEVLDLSRGVLADKGAAALIAGAAKLKHLKQLILDENFFSDADVAALKKALPNASLVEQKGDEDPEYRYTSIAE